MLQERRSTANPGDLLARSAENLFKRQFTAVISASISKEERNQILTDGLGQLLVSNELWSFAKTEDRIRISSAQSPPDRSTTRDSDIPQLVRPEFEHLRRSFIEAARSLEIVREDRKIEFIGENLGELLVAGQVLELHKDESGAVSMVIKSDEKQLFQQRWEKANPGLARALSTARPNFIETFEKVMSIPEPDMARIFQAWFLKVNFCWGALVV